jgi:N-acyl-D-aspartate/D-glutamate deacylase
MLDLVITGGLVLDGTGAPAVPADVGVAGTRIVAVGRLPGVRAAHVIRADGRVVSPGFIDMHAHDDFNLPVNPLGAEKTRQGVTTLVTGNCGLSPAPLGREHRQAVLDAVDTLDSGLDYEWPTFGAFLDRMPPLGLNAAALVGHGTVRTAVLGDEARAPRPDELGRMASLVGEAMAAGAFGLSTGLFGPPSGYAEMDEVVALARVAARYGGGYHTHMRDEGVRIAEAVREALEIGARAACPVQISHLKISSLDCWGRAPEVLATIAEARRRGVRVTCDQYPYHASSGGLRHHLPAWVHEGGLQPLLGRLADPDARARLRYDLVEGMARAGISLRFYRWDLTRVSESPTHPDYAGLTLAEIGAREGKAPVDALLGLLLADGGRTGGIYFHIDEEDVRAIMRDPHVGVGSDGLYTGRPGHSDRGRPHPRHFGTFPRVLGRYVRDEGILALPEAIRKMTSLSADVLGLRDRGRIRVGAAADLVVFDPATITDRATFEAPHQPPVGIAAVVVNGVPVVLDGEPTGATPGRVLRHGRPDHPGIAG